MPPPVPATALLPHHIRQLHWRADASDSAAAAALRQRLQQRGQRIELALAQALDDIAPGDGRTLHLQRLAISLDPRWLEAPDHELAGHVAAAVRQAWQGLRASDVSELGSSTAVAEPTDWLYSYLEDGCLPAALAACDADHRQRALRQAAAALAGSSDLLRLGGRSAGFDQRVAWFSRWLALWPEHERGPWLAHRRAGAAAPTSPATADALSQLDGLVAGLAAEQRLLAQAVKLAAIAAGPVSFDPQQRAADAAVREGALMRWLARVAALARSGEPGDVSSAAGS